MTYHRTTLRRFALLVSLSLGAIPFVSGCRSTPDESGGGAAVAVPAGNFAAHWRADVPVTNGGIRSLHLGEDRVFAYTADNRCYFIDRAQGGIKGQAQAARPRSQVFEPIVAGNDVILPSTYEVRVFSKEGAQKYRTTFPRFTASGGAAGDDKMILFGVDSPNGGRAVAVENKQFPYVMTPMWELSARAQVTATPVIWQEGAYVGSRDGNVYAVRAADRNPLWPALPGGVFKTGGEIQSDLAVDKDGLYVASMDGKLYCLDPNTGRLRWTYYSGQTLRETSHPYATANTVYIYVPYVGVAAIDKAHPNELRPHKWVASNTRQFLAADAQHAYLRGDDNAIVAVDLKTGTPKFKSQRNDFVAFASNNSDKDPVIYGATASGNVYAVRPVLKPGSMGEMVLSEQAVERVAAR